MVSSISLDQVSLTLEGPILHDISLDLQPGITCLLGPNGAGKTMTNRLIGLLQEVTSGAISWDGTVVNPLTGDRLDRIRSIGFMHQQPVFVNKSVRENVGLPLKFRGTHSDDMVDTFLEDFDLKVLADRNVLKLSKGQQQRVALARTLISRPGVIVLDEPTSSLDMQTTKWIEERLRRLRETSSAIIVWTTHDQFQVRRVADQIAVILDGSIRESGTVDAVLDAASDPQVAKYLAGELI